MNATEPNLLILINDFSFATYYRRKLYARHTS